MKGSLKICGYLLLLQIFLMAPVFALQFEPILFETAGADKALNEAEQHIKQETKNIRALEIIIDRLEKIKSNASGCIDKSAKQIKVIDDLVKERLGQNYESINGETSKYISTKRLYHHEFLSKCTLYYLRSQDAIYALNNMVKQLGTTTLLKKSTPIYGFTAIKFKDVKNITNFDLMLKKIGILELTIINYSILAGLLIIVLAISILILKYTRKHHDKMTDSISYSNMKTVIKPFVTPIIALTTSLLYLSTIFLHTTPTPTVLLILGYMLLFTIISFLFKWFILCFDYPYFDNFTLSERHSLYKKFKFILFLLVLCPITALILVEQNIPYQIKDISLAILFTALLFTIGNILNTLMIAANHKYSIAISSSITTIVAASIALTWLGYHALMKYFIASIILSLLSIYALSLSFDILHGKNQYVSTIIEKIKLQFFELTGLKKKKSLPEVLIIKGCVYIFLCVIFIFTILSIWVTSDNFINQTSDAILEGFKIFDVNFNLFRIFVSVLTFGLLLLITRILSQYIHIKRQKSPEVRSQVALASIFMYVGFIISLITALLLSGITFTGLAIIIGALSVGIGLGLQNIVNNFVSGILLLLEKPIKSGDRVLIGETEGHIKKIGVRSTQLITLAKEDVIIPNADLIANQITNYMLRNQFWRVICRVGVKYGSDTELVKSVLLQVAKDHTDVIQEAPNQPVVLFQDFGDSSLVFELWCIIRDVNRKYHMASDLRFAIDNAFRANSITIAFPQRDIHVKEYPLLTIEQRDKKPKTT